MSVEEETVREPSGPGAVTLGTTWGSWKTSKNRSTFTDDFRPGDQRQIVKFLDGEPFAVVDRHWIQMDRGPTPFWCLASIGQSCPLCRMLGDKPTSTALLTILTLDHAMVDVQRWATTGRVARTLSDYAEDPTIRALDRSDLYFSVIKNSGGGGKRGAQSVVSILPVKARDLAEDYGIKPLTQEELERFQERRLKADSIKFPSVDDLNEVVRSKMSGSSDY